MAVQHEALETDTRCATKRSSKSLPKAQTNAFKKNQERPRTAEKHPQHKLKDLRSNPQHPWKKSGMAACVCGPKLSGECLLVSQPSQNGDPPASCVSLFHGKKAESN